MNENRQGNAVSNVDDSVDDSVFNGNEISSTLRVLGAKTHNLQNVDVDIPLNKITTVTGPSGSGKSSLVFDTIHMEGQRQYMESMTTSARQYLRRLTRPPVEKIIGLQPTIALEQRTREVDPRSLVATVTEIYDFLRVLYAKVGIAHCYKCGRPIDRQSAEQIAQSLLSLPENTRFMLLAPVARDSLGSCEAVIQHLVKLGFTRARIDGALVNIESSTQLDPNERHNVDVVVDRLILRPGIEPRLNESIKETLKHGEGFLYCLYEKERATTEQGTVRSVWKDLVFSSKYTCPKCDVSYSELEPRSFSFHSPYGACSTCHGLGKSDEFDIELLVPNPNLTLDEGALVVGKNLSTAAQQELSKLLAQFKELKPESYAVPIARWDDETRKIFFDGVCVLDEPETDQDDVEQFDGYLRDDALYSSDDVIISRSKKTPSGVARIKRNVGDNKASAPFQGLVPFLNNLYLETKKEREREYLESCRGQVVCRECNGTRLKREARSVTVGDKTIYETIQMTAAQALDWFQRLSLNRLRQQIAEPLVAQIVSRLETMSQLRLDYLTLDRPSSTLSGGELQRSRLTTVLGGSLVGACYILDEPTIGLHPRDVGRLLDTVRAIRERGNTVILVEHNENVIRESDWTIDFGPGAGVRGGKVLAEGTPEEIASNELSPTGRFLSGKDFIPVPKKRRKAAKTRSITIEGARVNNLKDITVSFPLGLFVCVTGASGSGKSSLVNKTLAPLLRKRLRDATEDDNEKERLFKSVRGASRVDKLVVVDQTPLGRSARSNPATYSGIYDEIRKVFASSLDARRRGFKAGRFSFNIAGGRCEYCQGLGVRRIESSVLPDVYAPCPECEGKRFNKETLDVKYLGMSIADVLDASFDKAGEIFANHASIMRYIESFQKVGLGYLALGQSATTLSGGEAQRVKLATELAGVETGNTLYILDEPTTGLHPRDIVNLLDVLNKLVDAGNTVVVIEHSLDIMKSADWIIDLGPEGGERGGYVLATGTPEEIAQLDDNETARYLREVL